jgi:hypothetical protein
MLRLMPSRRPKTSRGSRPPRIRVPNREKALFVVDNKRFVGVLQRLSLTGGSAVLAKGPIPPGTHAEMNLNTVFGKVTAQIEFLHTGADGMPLAQAFHFIAMDETSSDRFSESVRQMEEAGFSDAAPKDAAFGDVASRTVGRLWDNIRQLADAVTTGRRS